MDYSSEADVHSDYLRYLLIERIKDDTDDLEMHCKSIIHTVLRRLSLSEPWDTVIRQYYGLNTTNAVKETSMADLAAEAACKVCIEDLPGYILDVERSIRVAWQTTYFLQGRFDYTSRIFDFLYEDYCFEHAFRKDDVSFPFDVKKGWVALHALTLLNPGNRDELGELSVLSNPMIQANSIGDPSATTTAHASTGKSKQDENINNLQGIIEDLKCFGSSDVVPDEEETQLLHKIWHNVSSSVDSFICSLAYEQRQCVIKSDSLSGATLDFMNSVRRHGLRTAEERKNDSILLGKLWQKMLCTANKLGHLRDILKAYKQALQEKLVVAQV